MSVHSFLLTAIKPADDPPLFTCEKGTQTFAILPEPAERPDTPFNSPLSHEWLTGIRNLSPWNQLDTEINIFCSAETSSNCKTILTVKDLTHNFLFPL